MDESKSYTSVTLTHFVHSRLGTKRVAIFNAIIVKSCSFFENSGCVLNSSPSHVTKNSITPLVPSLNLKINAFCYPSPWLIEVYTVHTTLFSIATGNSKIIITTSSCRFCLIHHHRMLYIKLNAV